MIHNISYLQGFQNTIKGILKKIAKTFNDLILYFHVRINILKNIDTYMTDSGHKA